ncbi:MAG: membrane protein insertion efficiency factor YidD [Spirochaetaceae bacterium]|nr:MAG: membrane protein insertion efficiency factor YidD [Spirochaetaceae bacterium]
MPSVRRLIRAVAVLPIRAYQLIVSPFFPASCRYFPTCSSYVREAIMRHGVLAGVVLGLARILRCSRFFSGGFDPVPDQFSLKAVGRGYREFRSRRAHGPEEGDHAE